MSGFTRTNWVNFAAPSIEARELNRIEQGIVDAHDQLDDTTADLVAAIGQLETVIAAALNHLGNRNNPDGVTPAMVGLPPVQADVEAHLADLANPHKTTAKQIGLGGGTVNLADRGVSPTQSGTWNTNIVQAVLDELESYGGGEVLFPWAAGTVIPFEGVWVPGNITFTGNGAVLRKTREGVTFERGINGEGERFGATAMLCIREQSLLGKPRPSGVTINHLVLQGAEGYVSAIDIYADDVTIIDSTVMRIPDAAGDPRSWFDGIYIQDARRILIDNTLVEYGGRNNLSIVGGQSITIKNSVFRNCTGKRGDGLDFDLSPGCGIEIEPDRREQASTDILIQNCDLLDNAGAGIGFDLSPPGADSVLDGNATRITIDNCYVNGNGRLPFAGGSPGEAVATVGAFYVTGGEAAGHGRITLTSNRFTNSIRGAGINAQDSRTELAAVGNDLRGNQAGAVSPSANLVTNTGNLT